jgi:sulfur carrier protein ThiS
LIVNVKLYGTLGRSIDGYDHLSGLDLTLPEDSLIGDLLDHFNLSPERLGMVSMDGAPLQPGAPLKDGGQIKIFQPIFGG